jgi:hypothetical protein
VSFFEIFQPGLRHLREERLKTLVSRPTHGGGAPLGIDLEGGRAVFKMPTPSTADTPPAELAEKSDDRAPSSDLEPDPTLAAPGSPSA